MYVFELRDQERRATILYRTGSFNEVGEPSLRGDQSLIEEFERWAQIAKGPFGLNLNWPNAFICDLYFALSLKTGAFIWPYEGQMTQGQVEEIVLDIPEGALP